MTEYRLYFFDGDRHIRHAVDLNCESDDEAIAAVETISANAHMELWRGAILVRGFPRSQPG